MKSLFLFLLLMGTVSAGSVRIFNDSPFTLNAEVLAADGSSKGKLSISPQQQGNWNDNASVNATWSQTPYTVILTCKSGGQFGVISGIQQGATVTALSAKGNLYCEPDKKEQQGQTSPQPSPNQAPQGGDPIWGPP